MELETNPNIANNAEVTQSLTDLAETLNGKAEYYVGGGLAAYLISGSDFDREFSDIDIMIPEAEMPALGAAFKEAGYDFWDEREAHQTREDLVGPHGHHEFGGRDKIGRRIGIYTFDYLPDGRIVLRNHFGEKDASGRVIDKTRETVFPAEITKEDLFSNRPAVLADKPIPTITAEQIYLRKLGGKRPKDMSDAKKLESFIDPVKLAKLQAAIPKVEVVVS